MNRKSLQVFIAVMVLMSLTAALLLRIRSNYVLGKPGVVLGDVPIYSVSKGQTSLVSHVSVPLPTMEPAYRSEPLTIDITELRMLPSDTVFGRRLYTSTNDNWQAMISVVLMGTDRTSIHKPQYCLLGQGEQIIGSEIITIPISKPHPYDLSIMKLTTASQRRGADGRPVPTRGLYMYWFVADGALTAKHGERMWLMGKNLFTTGLLQRWAYVAYWSVCSPGGEDKLLERMKNFIAESVPQFQTATGPEAVRTTASLSSN